MSDVNVLETVTSTEAWELASDILEEVSEHLWDLGHLNYARRAYALSNLGGPDIGTRLGGLSTLRRHLEDIGSVQMAGRVRDCLSVANAISKSAGGRIPKRLLDQLMVL